MSLVTRKRLFISLGIFAVLIILYTLIGFFGAPWYAKRYLSDYVATELQRDLTIEELHFNPYTLVLESKNIFLAEENGDPIAGIGRAYANIDLNELFSKTIIFARTILEQPRLDLIINEQGELNVDRLINDLPKQPDEQPSEPSFNVEFASSEIIQGQIHATDRSKEETISSTMQDINLQISGISTIEREEKGQYQIALDLDNESELNLQGKLSLIPLASNGQFEATDVSVGSLSKWIDESLPVHELTGQVNIKGDYSLTADAEGNTQFTVSSAATNIKEFSAHDRHSSMTFSLEDLSFDDLSYESVGQQIILPKISLANLVLNKDESHQLINLASINLVGIEYSGAESTVNVTNVGLGPLMVNPREAGKPFLNLESLDLEAINYSLSDNQLSIAGINLGKNQVLLETNENGQYVLPTVPARETRDKDNSQNKDEEIAVQDSLKKEDGDTDESARFTFKLDELSVDENQIAYLDKGKSDKLFNLASLNLTDLEYSGVEDSLILSTIGLGKITVMPREKADPFLSLANLDLKSINYGLINNQLEIASINLGDNKVLFETDSDGHYVLPSIPAGEGTTKQNNSKESENADKTSEFLFKLGELSLNGTQVGYLESASADSEKELANLSKATLTKTEFDLSKQKTVIQALKLADANFNLSMDKTGTINVVNLFAQPTPESNSKAEKPAVKKEQEPDSVELPDFLLNTFEVKDFNILFDDLAREPALQHKITNLSLSASNISTAKEARTEMSLSAGLNEEGILSLEGWVMPATLQSEIQVALDDLDLAVLDAYIRPATNLKLQSGSVSVVGAVNYAPDDTGLKIENAEAGLANILINHSKTGEKLLAVSMIDAKSINLGFDPVDIRIKNIKLTDPYANVHIDEQQNLNLLDAFNAGKDEESEEKADDTSEESTLKLAVERIDVEQGNMDFADLSLTPKFSTKIHELKGTAAGLSSTPEKYASMEINGRVDEYGTAKITGELQPFDIREQTKINLKFNNINTESLSPYTAKFAGRKIKSGSLSLDLDYTIKNSQLDGKNNIVLESLTLGEAVQSPEAKDLPLDMAISLLEDKDGKIDINLPISGDLNNPKFAIDEVIQKAISNLVTGIVTAPFKFIGSLFGGSGEDLQAISFEPGRAVITPPEAENIATLTKVLTDRPALTLMVAGAYDPELDKTALARETLIATLSEESGEDATPLNFSDPGTQIILDRLALDRLDISSINSLKEKFDVEQDRAGNVEAGARDYYEAVFNLLVEKNNVDKTMLESLALKRAEAIIMGFKENAGDITQRISIADTIKSVKADGDMINIMLEAGTTKSAR